MRFTTIRHIFVYGTLKRGRSPQAQQLAETCSWMGEAKLAGRLIDLGSYPALLPAATHEDFVHGELWRLPDEADEADAVLDFTDRYEGCHPDDPEPHEYCRIVCTALDFEGVRTWCWTYLYPWGGESHAILKNGRW
jgi:gamma-glutamylcyclotransferase (GGCT)/AIG2-like uncharacterized protein YtfP